MRLRSLRQRAMSGARRWARCRSAGTRERYRATMMGRVTTRRAAAGAATTRLRPGTDHDAVVIGGGHNGLVTAAYLARADVPLIDLPALIETIARSLGAVAPASEARLDPRLPRPPTPEQVRASVTPEALISFENGRRYKLLRRHLGTRGLTPAQYRAKWGLPPDYPMVAPNLHASRSAISRRWRLSLVRSGR